MRSWHTLVWQYVVVLIRRDTPITIHDLIHIKSSVLMSFGTFGEYFE